jgi:hypothetical protein
LFFILGMEEEWKNQMEFWTENVDIYCRQRQKSASLHPKLAFDLNHLSKIYVSSSGLKPNVLSDILVKFFSFFLPEGFKNYVITKMDIRMTP